MRKSVVIWGMGEIGGVFARGFLKSGYAVFPINRQTKMDEAVRENPDPQAVIVTVGEKDMEDVLNRMPNEWKDLLVLVQNELLPCDWECFDLDPTVISVWFEKKFPSDYKVIIPSPVYGKKSNLVKTALNAINIDVKVCGSREELLKELIIKNLYILTTNISGLEVGGTVGDLWREDRNVAQAVASDVLDVQFMLADKEFDRKELIKGMVAAFNGDPDHKCMGRSAPARLERALILSEKYGLPAEKLKKIQAIVKK